MVASIFITSSEGFSGKSAVVFGVLDTLTKRLGRVGVFRPVYAQTPDGDIRDDVLPMLLEHLDPSVDLALEDAVGVSYEEVHANPDRALTTIIDRFERVARSCDAVVILGSDFTDVGNPAELSFNARVAANLGAPVLLVLTGRNPADLTARTPAQMAQVASITLPEITGAHATTIGVIINRSDADALPEIREAVAQVVGEGVPVWALPENDLLTAPTVHQLLDAVDGRLHSGDGAALDRVVRGTVISGMSMEHVLERAFESAVVVIAADRTETLVALLLAQRANTLPNIAAIVVNGPYPFSPIIERLIEGSGSSLPIVRTEFDTFETAQRIISTRGSFGRSTRAKIDAALSQFAEHVDADAIVGLLDVPATGVVTPLMFEHRLLDRARANRKRVVLPEGNDDRILQAAATLLTREVADLTILGDPDAIARRANELGLALEGAQLLSPHDPGLVKRFAEEYQRLRAHKGMTLDEATDRVQDVSYFGTMMVHLGLADGMVSGAAHTTAHTIKPSFEIVKTKPGTSIVSSVFLMSLADRVLVYGDCAVNPDPTAPQLADIAISSAQTARVFDIDPRVAMLSYSTGESGAGADVDKVREATSLVRDRDPQLRVEGPIQYDAASDAGVAAKKMPDSEVAGQATVFIFPDLNTGNNTYKAVQRSAGAVAIGPVLQGLNKPINDLSRGALVSDIINTVAITAIQAQSEQGAAE